MAIQLIKTTEMVPIKNDRLWGEDARFLNSLRDRAGRALGQRILLEAALYRRIDPAKDDLIGGIKHQWLVGVERDMDAVKCLDQQLDAARREGMRMGAEIVANLAEAYNDPRVRGSCKHVLHGALRDAARTIDEKANTVSA